MKKVIPVKKRTFNASEVLMLMLDCGANATQLYWQVPAFQMQAEFILSSNDDMNAKRLALHSLLLNMASQIITDYCKAKDSEDKQGDDENGNAAHREDLQ